MITIKLHRNFRKQFQKLNQSQKIKFRARRDIFLQDAFNPILNNHALKGEYQGYRSINIGGDLRAIFTKRSDEIVFVKIGSHSELYS